MLIGMSYLFPMQRGKNTVNYSVSCMLGLWDLGKYHMHIIYICNDQLLLHYTAKFGKEHMQKQRKNNKKHTGGLRNHNFGKTKNTWEKKQKLKQKSNNKNTEKSKELSRSSGDGAGWPRVLIPIFFQSLFLFFSNLRSRLWFFQVYWFFQIWARKASGRLFYFYIFLFFPRYF